MGCLAEDSHILPMVKTNNEDVEVKGSDSKTKSSDEIIYTRNVTIDLNNMDDAIGPQTNIPYSCDDENYQHGNDTNSSYVINAKTNKPRNRDDVIDERNINKQEACDTNGDSLVPRELVEDVLQEIENNLDILEDEDKCKPSVNEKHKSSNSDNESIQDNNVIDQVASSCAVSDRYQYVPVDVAEDVLREIENKLGQLEDIPDICNDIPIECFCEDTQHRLCYHLDPESHTMAESGLTKDYMGLGEWIQLESLFMKYLHRTMMTLKTIEVLGKWITSETGPHPTIGNFKDCMINGIDRPDVVMDMAEHITKDAIAWIRMGSEACTAPQTKTDKSWQLTRHDVIKGVKMKYTCCLAYADEDEGMAQIITDLYTKASPGSLFFRPQWDLKHGKYEYETTARVIEERCDGKIVFLISEYFLASNICRFAVNFARNLTPEGDQGRLIPFLLTDNYSHIPTVLRGIAGIKWHNTWSRSPAWTNLPGAIYCDHTADQQRLIRLRVKEELASDPDRYLRDPPYDENISPPKDPIFSPDSDECRASSIENLDESVVIPSNKAEKAKQWLSKKWESLTKRVGRRNDQSPTTSTSTSMSTEYWYSASSSDALLENGE